MSGAFSEEFGETLARVANEARRDYRPSRHKGEAGVIHLFHDLHAAGESVAAELRERGAQQSCAAIASDVERHAAASAVDWRSTEARVSSALVADIDFIASAMSPNASRRSPSVWAS